MLITKRSIGYLQPSETDIYGYVNIIINSFFVPSKSKLINLYFSPLKFKWNLDIHNFANILTSKMY